MKLKKLKELLKENLKIRKGLEKYIPSSYQRIGDIIILKIRKELEQYEKEIAEIVAKNLPKVKTVCKLTSIENVTREPKIKILYGRETETVHKENKCLFKLDVSKIMFSKGNQYERIRLTKVIKENEKIIDLTSGIGYFSIPIAKFCKIDFIIAIDINKNAIKYLKENIKLNKIKNIFPVIGDSRLILKENFKFDRAIVGHIFDNEDLLKTALKIAKRITYHTLIKKEHVENFLKKYKVEYFRKVKKYKPYVYHYVFDIVN